MYRCENCSGSFNSFKVAGQCPLCKVWASVKCTDCSYIASANVFINNNNLCPECGTYVGVGGTRPGNNSIDQEAMNIIHGCLAIVSIPFVIGIILYFIFMPEIDPDKAPKNKDIAEVAIKDINNPVASKKIPKQNVHKAEVNKKDVDLKNAKVDVSNNSTISNENDILEKARKMIEENDKLENKNPADRGRRLLISKSRTKTSKDEKNIAGNSPREIGFKFNQKKTVINQLEKIDYERKKNSSSSFGGFKSPADSSGIKKKVPDKEESIEDGLKKQNEGAKTENNESKNTDKFIYLKKNRLLRGEIEFSDRNQFSVKIKVGDKSENGVEGVLTIDRYEVGSRRRGGRGRSSFTRKSSKSKLQKWGIKLNVLLIPDTEENFKIQLVDIERDKEGPLDFSENSNLIKSEFKMKYNKKENEISGSIIGNTRGSILRGRRSSGFFGR